MWIEVWFGHKFACCWTKMVTVRWCNDREILLFYDFCLFFIVKFAGRIRFNWIFSLFLKDQVLWSAKRRSGRLIFSVSSFHFLQNFFFCSFCRARTVCAGDCVCLSDEPRVFQETTVYDWVYKAQCVCVRVLVLLACWLRGEGRKKREHIYTHIYKVVIISYVVKS